MRRPAQYTITNTATPITIGNPHSSIDELPNQQTCKTCNIRQPINGDALCVECRGFMEYWLDIQYRLFTGFGSAHARRARQPATLNLGTDEPIRANDSH